MSRDDAIRALVFDPRPYVRMQALRYFTGTCSADPELVPLALEMARRYPEEPLSAWMVDRCTLSDAALPVVVEMIASDADVPEGLASNLLELVLSLPIEVLRRLPEQFNLDDTELPDRIPYHEQLAATSDEALWGEFLADNDDHPAAIYDFPMQDLLQELLRRQHPSDAELRSWLETMVEDEICPAQLAAIRILGQRKVRAAALELLSPEAPLSHPDWQDEATRALIRMADADLVRLLCERFPTLSDDGQVIVSEALSYIRLPEAEAGLRALLAAAPDRPSRANLAIALCNAFSAESLELVLAEARINAAPGGEFDLREPALALAQFCGYWDDELQAWQAAVDAEFRDEQERYLSELELEQEFADSVEFDPDFEEEYSPDADDFVDDDDAYDDADDEYADDDDAWEAEDILTEQPRLRILPPGMEPISDLSDGVAEDDLTDFEPTQPIRKSTFKVGRNDPCPCGSGKKFKKCCGGKG